MAYPDGTELGSYLTAAGIVTTGLDLDTAAAAGVLEVERATGRVFVAVAATHAFTPPSSPQGALWLYQDLLSLTSATYRGEPRMAGTDFYLEPENGGVDERPYTSLLWQRQFPLIYTFQQRRSISLTGSWGYSADVPADVRLAMLASGAMWLLASVGGAMLAGGRAFIETWHEADVSESYGKNPLDRMHDDWAKQRDMACTRVKRVTVGL